MTTLEWAPKAAAFSSSTMPLEEDTSSSFCRAAVAPDTPRSASAAASASAQAASCRFSRFSVRSSTSFSLNSSSWRSSRLAAR